MLVGFPLVAAKNESAVLPILGIIIFRGISFISNSELCRKACYSGVSPWYMTVKGEGLPVMLLHGFMEDRRIWDSVLVGMENKYRWILPDLPGSGQSAFNGSLHGIKGFCRMHPRDHRKGRYPGIGVNRPQHGRLYFSGIC